MARSGVLRALLSAWAGSDDQQFLANAEILIAEEQRRGHTLLAQELRQALSDPRRPGARSPLTLRPIPKSREEHPLLQLSKPSRDFADLVLSPSVEAAVFELVRENEHRGALLSRALRPRQKLLLVGPSGAGKSATAHAIASQLSLPVATASLAALTSSYLGETARHIESVISFAEATPCVLLFDEIDALATERSNGQDHGELRRVVATFLQVLEEARGESVIVATSNHPQMLDSAIWRRFDEVIRIGIPGEAEIEQLLRVKLSGFHSKIDRQSWSHLLVGKSSADIERVCIDAMRSAVLEGEDTVTHEHMQRGYLRLESRVMAASVASVGSKDMLTEF